VYIAAAQCLNVQPVNCLAIEDSPVGLKAALAAGMKCVVVPNRDLLEGDFEGAQAKFDSLRDLLDSHRQLLANWNLKGSSSQPAAP
jgi:sugar-phosphatase